MKKSNIDRIGLERWNPITGCTKYSAGCKHCYAERMANKLASWNNPRYENGFEFKMHEDLLEKPLKVKKGRKYFVCSMSDLFHENATDEFILKVFETMNLAQQHTFMVVTKRAERLIELNDRINWSDNIIMGVTIESDKYEFRADLLRQTGALHKYLSLKPLLSSLNTLNLDGIDWLLVGGESGGEAARPVKIEWIRELRDKSVEANIPFYFRQWGRAENNPDPLDPSIKNVKGGLLLDGQTWKQLPSVLQ
ncbi:MAG: DUF5131 family protein [Calditrichaeota bacterium]|nr:MAG: DUF5131 family protein [Calditrichota bacterium]MBL1208040.1 DUF5131 family protein [Calditrichota bacterium]NOG47875.1 DUF5131 family protein [Calditrichota bacterium]